MPDRADSKESRGTKHHYRDEQKKISIVSYHLSFSLNGSDKLFHGKGTLRG